MQSAPPSTAVGIDLGSSTTTVMVRRNGEGSASNIVDPVPDQISAGDTFSAALVVPASWDDEKRAEHIEAAARAGFDRVELVPEPEAAARYYTEVAERELEPGAPLIVYSLGAESCNVGIVSFDGDRYEVHAAADADGVGGRRFDELLLEYLADWHRSTAPAFWLRIDAFGPNSERSALLDQVRAARERLTATSSTTIDIPGRELTVTRAELEAVIADTIAETADLAEQTLEMAEVGSARRAGLVLIGGASRTPLVANILERRLGIEPYLPEMPELVAAEGAALAAAEATVPISVAADGPVARTAPQRSKRPLMLLAVILAALVVATTLVVGLHQMVLDSSDGNEVPGAAPELDDYGPLPETAPPSESEEAAESDEPGEETEGEAPPPTGSDPEPDDAPTTGPGTSEETSAAPVPPGQPGPTAEDSQEPSSATVPNITGKSLSDAEQALADAGFTDVSAQGFRRTGDTKEYDDCEVTQQSPAGGQERPRDERISITYIYVGSDSC